jgi:hypothetical protein
MTAITFFIVIFHSTGDNDRILRNEESRDIATATEALTVAAMAVA